MNNFGHINLDAVQAIVAGPDDAVLAVITDVIGPSYRPVGAMMAIFSESARVGNLSSGCIEADTCLHAMRVLESDKPEIIRYGEGSPYIDIQLPCGGGLEILMIPRPKRQVLDELIHVCSSRRSGTLVIDLASGDMSIAEKGETGCSDTRMFICIEPEIVFNIFGKGPEASAFAALVRSLGYEAVLLSPDRETLNAASNSGCQTSLLSSANYPKDLDTDYRTAIILFFHDHDWEPPILAKALQTPAFYVGAQGSRKACAARMQVLEEMGVPIEFRARLRAPVGLIPSTRDPRTLAVSVLAEVLEIAMRGDS